jgi:membrane-bound serine protease (ClpP class)
MSSRRLILAMVLAALTLPFIPSAEAQPEQRIDIIDVGGIIDGSIERTVLATLEEASPANTMAVVLQIDSRGVVDRDRLDRMVEAVAGSDVPVITWIGPAGARGSNGAGLLALAGHVQAISPTAVLGPFLTFDLRTAPADLQGSTLTMSEAETVVLDEEMTAQEAEDAGLVQLIVPTLESLLREADGLEVELAGAQHTLDIDLDEATIRFNKLDLFGRALHAVAQPSIVYLLILLGLVGLVFELFHPSTGPAGISGLAALALGLFGVVTLGASWLGFALIVCGVVAFCIDLRFLNLSIYSVVGFALLVVGSVMLFNGPWLRVSPWVLGLGIVSMVLFLVSVMTRVLRDLRAIAAGEMEVTDPHPHPD